MRFIGLLLILNIGGPCALAQHRPPGAEVRWANLAAHCVLSGEARAIAMDAPEGPFAFACTAGDERFIFMVNLSNEERRIERSGKVEPLVPIFSSSGDVAAIPSIVITLPGDGTVIHENPIPPLTLVVFRPIRQHDIRPHGLDE